MQQSDLEAVDGCLGKYTVGLGQVRGAGGIITQTSKERGYSYKLHTRNLMTASQIQKCIWQQLGLGLQVAPTDCTARVQDLSQA